jgi:hypothetical protein
MASSCRRTCVGSLKRQALTGKRQVLGGHNPGVTPVRHVGTVRKRFSNQRWARSERAVASAAQRTEIVSPGPSHRRGRSSRSPRRKCAAVSGRHTTLSRHSSSAAAAAFLARGIPASRHRLTNARGCIRRVGRRAVRRRVRGAGNGRRHRRQSGRDFAAAARPEQRRGGAPPRPCRTRVLSC